MLLFVLWMAVAGAEEPEETIVVESERNLVRARARLDEAVRALDYLPGVQVDDRTVYMPRQIWEPPVVARCGRSAPPSRSWPSTSGSMRWRGSSRRRGSMA